MIQRKSVCLKDKREGCKYPKHTAVGEECPCVKKIKDVKFGPGKKVSIKDVNDKWRKFEIDKPQNLSMFLKNGPEGQEVNREMPEEQKTTSDWDKDEEIMGDWIKLIEGNNVVEFLDNGTKDDTGKFNGVTFKAKSDVSTGSKITISAKKLLSVLGSLKSKKQLVGAKVRITRKGEGKSTEYTGIEVLSKGTSDSKPGDE